MKQTVERRNTGKKSVQIIRNDLVRDHAKKRYPHLYEEVMNRDKASCSGWYVPIPESCTAYRRFCRSAWHREANREKGG